MTITPPSTYSGNLTLTVNATASETGASAVVSTQTITLDVSPVQSTGATIATPTTVADTENHAASFTLNVGDYSANASTDTLTNVSVTGAPNGSTLTVGGVAIPQNADGSFTLSPDQVTDASLAITPPTDYSGSMTLTVSATIEDVNGNLVTNTANTTVNVTAVTQGASIAAPTTVNGLENNAGSFALSVNDAHTNEAVTAVNITGAPTGSTLTVGGVAIAQNADGSFTLTPAEASDGSLSITPPTDYSGTIHLVVNATAQETGVAAVTTSQTITLNVGAVTQGATITAPTSTTGNENAATAISLNVSDTHTGETVDSVQIFGAPAGSVLHVDGVAVTANADGSFTLTAAQAQNGALAITPPTDYSGQITLQVDATAHNGTATSVTTVQTINMEVTPVTQGATITAPTTVTGTENSAASISLNVADTHLNESVTGVTISGAPAGSTLTVGPDVITANADGSFTLTAAQASNTSLQLTPPTDYTGTMTLTVSATADETGAAPATTTQTVTVDVTGITQGATISAPQAVGGLANSATPFTLSVTDGHLGESVTSVTISGAPAGSTMTVDGQTITANANGSFTLSPSQAANAGLAITPPANYTGTMNLTVTATADLPGAAAVTTTQTVSLDITAGASSGATISGPTNLTTTENHAASFALNIADTHTGESVSSVTITGAPTGTILTVDGATITANASGNFVLTPAQASNASLVITPPTDYSGNMSLQVQATSVNAGVSHTNTQNITLDVTAVTQGASVVAPAALVTNENTGTAIPLTIADTHTGESVTAVTITGAPAGSTLTVEGVAITADSSGTFHLTSAQANDSTLTITPPTDYSGTITLHVNAVAENGSAATATTSQAITLNVDAVSQGATITAPTSVTTTENHAASIPITIADTHTGESISSVVISGAPQGSTLTVGTHTYAMDSTGSFNLTPAQLSAGTPTLNPPNDFSGPIVLEIDATAANGTAAAVTTSQTVNVSVTGVVQGATIIAPTSASTTENHAASISLQVSDVNTGENVSAVSITGAPSGSTLTVSGEVISQNADGSFTLTPAQAASASLAITPPTDFSGTMTLKVNATASMLNATNETNTQTINVTVGAVTQGATITAPQAVGMFEGGNAQFSLNVGDSHTGESLQSVTITGAPTGSTITLGGSTLTSSNGTFTLTSAQVTALHSGTETMKVTPPSTYTGAFSLHVNAVAENGTAATVTTSQAISFDVSSTSSSSHHGSSRSGPKIAALNGALTDTENHSTSFILNTTDTRSGSSVDSVTITGAPVGTSLVINGATITGTTVTSGGVSTESFTVPSTAYTNGAVQITPPTGYYGTMNLTVTALDTSNRSTTMPVTVDVTQVSNGATISTTPNSVNTTPNSAASITLHVTDTNAGDTISSVTISGAPAGSTMTVGGATLTANAAGVFTLTSAEVTAAAATGGDALLVTPPHNYTGIMYLQVNATVQTAAGGTETNTQVVPVNVATPTIGATITAPTSVTVSENHSSSAFTLNVADTNLGESVSVVTITGAPSGAYLVDNGHIIHAYNGTFTLTPAQASNASLTIHPGHDYSGTMTLTVNATAINSQGITETNSQNISVVTGSVTQGATIEVPCQTVVGHEDQNTSLNAQIFDNHWNESVTGATITGAPAGSTLNVGGTIISQNASGAFVLTAAQATHGDFSLTPPTGYVGEVTLTINATAQNGSAAAVTTSQTITLNVEDVGPTASHSQSFTMNEGSSITESIGATGAAGNTLSYALESGEGPSNGTVSFDQKGDFTYTANAGYSGTDEFQVVVSDGHGGTVVQTEVVNVQNPFINDHCDTFQGHGVTYGDGGNDVFRSGSGAFAYTGGNTNQTVYANDGSDSCQGAHSYTTQLHITAAEAPEAYGATMSYCLNNVPDHASVCDANGNILDATHLTDAQINSGIYLTFPDTHVAASFDLSVTANMTDTSGNVTAAQTTCHVDTSFFGTTSTITEGNGNDTVYGAAGSNTITVGNGNDDIYAYDGNNTITVGSGSDYIQAGDGNNSISLTGSSGTDSLSLGDGLNNLNLGSGHHTNLSLTGTGGVDSVSISGGSLYVDLSHTTGSNTVVVNNPTGAAGAETFYMDFGGNDNITGAGGHGGNWVDTMDYSGHAAAGVALTIVDSTGVTHSISSTSHGTLNLAAEANGTEISGTVYSGTGSQQHELAHFNNIGSIVY